MNKGVADRMPHLWVIRDRVGQGRRWYLSASLRKRPKYCSAKNERNCQKRSDHTRFGLHFMSWAPSVRFQPLATAESLERIPNLANFVAGCVTVLDDIAEPIFFRSGLQFLSNRDHPLYEVGRCR